MEKKTNTTKRKSPGKKLDTFLFFLDIAVLIFCGWGLWYFEKNSWQHVAVLGVFAVTCGINSREARKKAGL